MYNNDVTYDEKWNTPENLAAVKQVEDKYFHKSVCAPSCPASWAPEVLDLLNLFEKELGIQWNESTIRAYYVKGNLYEWLLKDPVLSAISAFKHHFIEPKSEYYKDKGLVYKLLAPIKGFFSRYAYAKNAIRVRYVAPVMNRILKPKFALTQVKEKYGRLEIYFNAPEMYEPWIEKEITKCQIKIAMKGAYYPIESFWDVKKVEYVGTAYNGETTEVINYIDYKGNPATKVLTTIYRSLLKDMGLDVNDLENKAALRRKKDDEQP